MKFIQTVMYSGKDNESYVETRVRLYRQQATKSSLTLPPPPPHPNSCVQAIKRAHHQNFLWVRCTQTNIDPLHLRNNGWNVDSDGNVVPVRYTCSQLPASIKRKPRHYHDHGTDVESDGDNKENYAPQKKRRQRSRSDVESITGLSTGFNENTENSGSEAEDDECEHISHISTIVFTSQDTDSRITKSNFTG